MKNHIHLDRQTLESMLECRKGTARTINGNIAEYYYKAQISCIELIISKWFEFDANTRVTIRAEVENLLDKLNEETLKSETEIQMIIAIAKADVMRDLLILFEE